MPPAERGLGELSALRERVRSWLTTAPIQKTAGEGRGGIAGGLDPEGPPPFLYGEITGYRLSWASLYRPDPTRPDPTGMARAADFIARQ